jgi:hypothetical protein
MIKMSNSPVSVTEVYEGTIELDRKYVFTVEKTIVDRPIPPNFQPYCVKDIKCVEDCDGEIAPDVLFLIERTIINWGKKNGIGKSTKDE